jgi:HlyD family secretion protein
VKKLRPFIVILVLGGLGWAGYAYATRPPASLTLTGIVTTNDVIVSPQIAGQIGQLLVKEGDLVTRGQLVALITPDELRADSTYYSQSAASATSQVQEGEAALRFEQKQTDDSIEQAQATVASVEAQQKSAEATLDSATLAFTRNQALVKDGIVSQDVFDQARTARDAAAANVDALKKQVDAARAALALAQSNAEQIALRRSQLQSSQFARAAAEAQRTKADVRLAYTELRSPIDAIVDVLAVRQGEVVNAGQAVVTLINPDDLWVRCDVEETYIDRITIGEQLMVRLPSGVTRPGTVFYRGVDAGFATQRDVSRTKRDIKTFEVRLRVDNKDRALAVGMTAYVELRLK